MKRVLSIIITLLFSFTNSTCKKISKYDFDLHGLWVSQDGYCGYMYLDIKNNDEGEFGTKADYHFCQSKNWKGTVRYNDSHFYVGLAKLSILEKPSSYNGNDSLEWYYQNKLGTYKILAKMKVKSSSLHKNETYIFNKIINY